MPAFAVRFSEFNFWESGGCQIGRTKDYGKRPISHIIDVMNKFGVASQVDCTCIRGMRRIHQKAEVMIDIREYSDKPNDYSGSMVSGATKAALLCVPLAKRVSLICPHVKTEVLDLISILRSAGYYVNLGKDKLIVEAPDFNSLNPIRVNLSACPSELITYISVAIYSDISVAIKFPFGLPSLSSLSPELDLLKKMNIRFDITDNQMMVPASQKVESLNIQVRPHGIQSDHHPLFLLMLMKGNRKSKICEHVFRDRFAYITELNHIGASLLREGNSVHIRPSNRLLGGKTVRGQDVRGTAALLIASLDTLSSVRIEESQHLLRGYEQITTKLNGLGADISSFWQPRQK